MAKRNSNNNNNKAVTRKRRGANTKRATDNNCSVADNSKHDRDATINDSSNDPAWYAASPEMLVAASSISYNNPLGTRIDLRGGNVKGRDYSTFSFPGILTLRMTSTPGYANSNNSPVNIAARNIYSFVRHANSGASNYNSPDLMLYLLAIDSLYSFHAFLTRAYGILMTYSQTNRYYPRVIIEAMGLNFDDLVTNGTDFNYYINNLGVKISSLVYPANMTFTTRHTWMYSNIYVDGMTSKAQSYMFIPDGFYVFNPTKYTTGGCCAYASLPYGPQDTWTLDQIRDFGNTMVNALMEDEDSNIMSGDILKAYGADKVMKIGPVPLDYTITPVFDMEVLTQINNATIMGLRIPWTDNKIQGLEDKFYSGDIYQYQNNLRYEPNITIPAESDVFFDALDVALKQVVNMPIDNPTAADTMVATRLKTWANLTYTSGLATSMSLVGFGSEIVLTADIITMDGDGTVSAQTVWYDYSYDTTMGSELVNSIADLSNFDYAPIIITYNRSGSEAFSQLNVVNDIANFALLDYGTYDKMNETALLSMYTVPQFASARQW